MEEYVSKAGNSTHDGKPRDFKLDIPARDSSFPFPTEISVGQAVDNTFVVINYHFLLLQDFEELHGESPS